MIEKTYKQIEYSKKLKSPKWQKKRLEILNRDSYKCRFCEDQESTLHIHHISYSDGEPWDIDNNLLITLCESCHQEETIDIKNKSTKLISFLKGIGFTSIEMFDLMVFFYRTEVQVRWSSNPTFFNALEYYIRNDKTRENISKVYEIALEESRQERIKQKEIDKSNGVVDIFDF